MNRTINTQTGICFFRIEKPSRLGDFLLRANYEPLALTPDADLLSEWFDYGCVYINGVRRRGDHLVNPGEVIRLHTRRKHFLSDVDLRRHIVEETEDFLVLDKPANLPTHPTLDNYLDNAKVMLEQQLGIPIYTTHRLDVPTQGLLIFAKTQAAQRTLNRLFSEGRVEKIYRSLNPRQVPLGKYIHFMDPESRVPKFVQEEEREKWWRCELEVLKNEPRENHFWHEIRLLTGKTHQIRAQMARLGSPVLDDVVYSTAGGDSATVERIALECFRLSFAFRSRTFAISRPLSLVAPSHPCR